MAMRWLLEENEHLCIWCLWPDCRRKVRWSALKACDVLGPDTTMPQAQRRMVCSRCGARGREGFVDVHPCTLDQAAAHARSNHARLSPADQVRNNLPRILEGYRKLIQETEGDLDLAGDGPVQWPIEGRSKPR